jgi:hypothetical protein
MSCVQDGAGAKKEHIYQQDVATCKTIQSAFLSSCYCFPFQDYIHFIGKRFFLAINICGAIMRLNSVEYVYFKICKARLVMLLK